ncbi:MAG: ferrochelatase [Candidatus Latescibacteria bacterium]|nr:ferrochelatase [Candidatus Latescibacterota bacterium]
MQSETTRTDAPIGVLLAQLGTPEAPTAVALRPYLREFLSDPRVIDLPRWQWLPILHLLVLTRRPARSAALYRRIWQPEGSPLLLHSQAQAKGLQERLGPRYLVALGMRYGRPALAAAMQQLQEAGAERLLVFPMFPQFSCSTTGSIYDGVNRAAFGRRCPLFFERRRQMPTLRFVPPYYDHPEYIAALKTSFQEDLERAGLLPDHYLLTFHGIPHRYIAEGDPYRRHCEITARLLAQALQLRDDQWTLGFQSRFGKEPWLEPYTDQLLHRLPGQGVRTLAAACPGFTADCLETLDEIGNEGGRQFREGGGQTLHLTPCLNSYPAWLEAMASIVRQESAGWI